jgi:DNA-binding response OmpR family regulator
VFTRRRPATILVASHDWNIREVLCEMFERAGHHTFRAETAEDALVGIAEHTFDVVILDGDLPHADLELCRLAAQGNLVMISGATDVAGGLAEASVSKPIHIEELLKKVEDLLSNARTL